jgi:hypothetical protein
VKRKERIRIMNLFSRWKKGDGEIRFKHNHKSVLIGNKQGLFGDIVGFKDVKTYLKWPLKQKDMYICCYVVLHHLGNHCL